VCHAGLPDGWCFCIPKSQFGYILEGVGKENVGIVYNHLVSFMANVQVLWSFGIFSPILECCTKTNLATLVSGSFAELARVCIGNGHFTCSSAIVF
jgi:hypothetical protein